MIFIRIIIPILIKLILAIKFRKCFLLRLWIKEIIIHKELLSISLWIMLLQRSRIRLGLVWIRVLNSIIVIILYFNFSYYLPCPRGTRWEHWTKAEARVQLRRKNCLQKDCSPDNDMDSRAWRFAILRLKRLGRICHRR